jgi:hypothetical protein
VLLSHDSGQLFVVSADDSGELEHVSLTG